MNSNGKNRVIMPLTNSSLEKCPAQVVVCSRLEEYERVGVPLQLNGAICLRELTDNQIQAYLDRTHQPNLWQQLHQDALS
jgi:hypothetical protein